jgi:dTDP-4-amino-4,6-dideoxygalactose transaminase
LKKFNVSKPFLPPKNELLNHIDDIYDSGWITNNGPKLKELESRLEDYLGVRNLVLVSNGTMALDLAYKLLGIQGKVLTTPFSFIATASSLKWAGLQPKFVDINPDTLNINEKLISLDSNCNSLVATHVFGNPCNVDEIKHLQDKSNLKVVYDGAHAFNVLLRGNSVLNFGDISTLSFHATKVFHTIEGGALIINDDELAKKARSAINFGISGKDEIGGLGVNYKINEFQAAMGLAGLKYLDHNFNVRKNICETYRKTLTDKLNYQYWNENASNNYSYMPVMFDTEDRLLYVKSKLEEKNIFLRRYFYPCLSNLKFLGGSHDICPVAENVSARIACLPLYTEMKVEDAAYIAGEVNKCL